MDIDTCTYHHTLLSLVPLTSSRITLQLTMRSARVGMCLEARSVGEAAAAAYWSICHAQVCRVPFGPLFSLPVERHIRGNPS